MIIKWFLQVFTVFYTLFHPITPLSKHRKFTLKLNFLGNYSFFNLQSKTHLFNSSKWHFFLNGLKEQWQLCQPLELLSLKLETLQFGDWGPHCRLVELLFENVGLALQLVHRLRWSQVADEGCSGWLLQIQRLALESLFDLLWDVKCDFRHFIPLFLGLGLWWLGSRVWPRSWFEFIQKFLAATPNFVRLAQVRAIILIIPESHLLFGIIRARAIRDTHGHDQWLRGLYWWSQFALAL